MACFLVPAAEAAVTTIAAQVMENRENEGDGKKPAVSVREVKWLSKMLWGGSLLLMFEHLWHGEIAPWSPFITAMTSQADKMQALHEMSTVGVSMALAVTAVWGVMVGVSRAIRKKAAAPAAVQSESAQQ
ncbi:hypothetical protein IJT93_10040 [bacterium]|nr:hypothetical protein [bacterium]